jgi:HEAT repeat protein
MRIPPYGSTDEWFTWLTGRDPKKRQEATLILGGLLPDDAVAVEELAARLRDPNDEVVFWAMTGLACLESRASPALEELRRIAASHPRFGLRQGAVHALTRIAPADPLTKVALLDALRDSSPFVRRQTLQGLIEVPELSAGDLGAIQELENDPDPAVRNWVEISLHNIRLRESPAANARYN